MFLLLHLSGVCALTTGLVACTRFRTVTGMLVSTGMNMAWRHERAHRFFPRAVWCIDHGGLVLTRLIVATLVEEGAPLLVAVDDSVNRRSGKRVHMMALPGSDQTCSVKFAR